ncbi:MAG: DUF6089 family protein [Bacteroidota bacterium]
MKIILIITIHLITFSGFSQSSEVGLFLGCSYYLGDFNPKKHFNLCKPSGGIIHRYIFNSHFAIKNSFLYGTLYGDDSKTNNISQLKRNLHFKSSILDISTQLEFNFLPFEESIREYSLSHESKYLFSPYVFIGVSLFSFNPKAEVNDTWYELQPMGTEGQGTIAYSFKKKYSLTQLAIPIGCGIKFDISKKVNFAIEWGIRFSFTDYIDDVSTTYADPILLRAERGQTAALLSDRSLYDTENSLSNVDRQRGNSKDNDKYSFAGVMITYKLLNKYKEQKCPMKND